MTLLVVAILLASAFAVTNGLHDASNAIATLVATRVARPRHALALAAVFNLLGLLLVGGAVAKAIGGIVTIDPSEAVAVIAAGLLAAVAWNLVTWRFGCRRARGMRWSGALAISPPLAAFALVRAVRRGARRATRRFGDLAQAAQWATSRRWPSATAPTTRRSPRA